MTAIMKIQTMALVGALSLFACTQSKTIRAVDPMEALGLQNNHLAIIVDVRELDEIKSGLVKDAHWFATSKIQANPQEFKEFLQKQAGDKEVIFYCARGGRAGAAAQEASKQGFKASNMGGYSDWTSQKLPTQQPSL